MESIFSDYFANWQSIALLALLAVLIVVVLIGMLLVRSRRTNSLDNVLGMTIDDVGKMQNKGLLTPDETAKVRQAMARQMTRKLAPKPTETDLLTDPEVRRLEELARLKRESRTADQATGTTRPTQAAQDGGLLDQIPGALSAADLTTDDDVPLPPDVVSMAQLGLITAEELERIKQRIREKRSGTGL